MAIYAQAYALLVSHCDVDSEAAVKHVTGAIGALAKNIGLAETLHRAVLEVMADMSRPANAVAAWPDPNGRRSWSSARAAPDG